jgi:hypothetical protein
MFNIIYGIGFIVSLIIGMTGMCMEEIQAQESSYPWDLSDKIMITMLLLIASAFWPLSLTISVIYWVVRKTVRLIQYKLISTLEQLQKETK